MITFYHGHESDSSNSTCIRSPKMTHFGIRDKTTFIGKILLKLLYSTFEFSDAYKT